MPKIIENLESKLIEEAFHQIRDVGYSATTIRSIAKACGVGVGTVYNYFPSKDALLASYLLDDWSECVTAINAVSTYSDTCKPVLHCIYSQLQQFFAGHSAVFQDKAAASAFTGSFSRYHGLLRQQLAQPLEKFCRDSFTAEFIAEHQVASNPVRALQTVIQQLSKLGDTDFIARDIQIMTNEQPCSDTFPYFIPTSQLNQWRREVSNRESALQRNDLQRSDLQRSDLQAKPIYHLQAPAVLQCRCRITMPASRQSRYTLFLRAGSPVARCARSYAH